MEVFSEACQGHVKEAMIVHAADGFDELSNTCDNDVLWTSNGQIKRLRLHPKVLGMPVAKPEQLVVSSKNESISSTLQTIYGKAPREKQDIVVMNASAALVLGKVARDFKEGVELARESIRTGRAQDKLLQLVKHSGDETKLKEAEKRFL
jgi:anthranilate phosphoribosyltransferase